ncbi:YggT family protein [Undibacterium sp. CY18W]|uniref:YggT family protein n=1 Tax=Undibacterium hunanense TaxID=2762292 RepID=A0ABR6ZQK1_9BURK|nr:YggT family protein [Undibacterium hunanense]MBC3917775.1 YggT family protein [Undibacterium hunanense]
MLYEIFTFVIDTVTGLFAGFLLLRFWMQVQRVRPPMGLAQAIFQLTDWLVHPIRRVVPGFRGYDWATLIGAFLVALLAMSLNFWLMGQFSWNAILLLTVFRMVQWILYGLMALLVLEAIFSWVNPQAPFAPFIRALNEPLLSPLRKLIPPLGGLDFSPLVALIILQILNKVLSEGFPKLLMLL